MLFTITADHIKRLSNLINNKLIKSPRAGDKKLPIHRSVAAAHILFIEILHSTLYKLIGAVPYLFNSPEQLAAAKIDHL